MNLLEEKDVKTYQDHVGRILLEREAQNNLPIGILRQLAGHKNEQSPYLIYISEKEETTFMALRTPPHLWILPSVSTTTKEMMEELVQYLLEQEYEIPGVLGEEQAVHWFITACQQHTSLQPTLHMKQGIYKLDQLNPIPKREGEFVKAAKADLPLAEKWFWQYGKELGEKNIEEQAKQLASDMIHDEKMFLWVVDGIPVSMACRARETVNGATINAVFTPDEYKRKGYGTQVTYHLSELLLESGFQFCSLYTDMGNPTSNSIYQKIGYQWVGNSIVYHLK